ncbi:hypothetical protein [Flocculibacter collagenilyticus]|uniref:hypothetical protein n=1 Tax=Flocculibacter collagenilyticus TaxID=2744479 RepID=UPI0018F6EE97|nr:hypothetical protein [Flocculibacter collagenilyticus]
MQDSKRNLSIEQLYQQRKSSYQLPNSVKNQVKQQAKNQQSSWWQRINWHLSMASVCAASLLAVLILRETPPDVVIDANKVYVISHSQDNNDHVTYYHQVELYNDLSQQPPSGDSQIASHIEKRNKEVRVLLEAQHDQLISRLNTAKYAHQDTLKYKGLLKQTNDDWVIEVCDLGTLKVAEAIIKQLNSDKSILNMRAGQAIELVTNQRGFLLAIAPASQHNVAACGVSVS